MARPVRPQLFGAVEKAPGSSRSYNMGLQVSNRSERRDDGKGGVPDVTKKIQGPLELNYPDPLLVAY